tara:strand:+ start:870 stop:1499 length:630 start_codon:yes stop_codon:yes gene_type:complete
MKYNKNNTFSGINIYNKLDKDIQEIIDNYLIQMRKEEEEGIYNIYMDSEEITYRRFMTEYNLHYKFNNSIMKSIVANDTIYKNSEYEEEFRECISDIIWGELICEDIENIDYTNIRSNMIDKLIGSIDYVIGKMFMNKNDNEELFLKVCKILNKNPFRLLSEGCIQSIENYGDSDIFIGDCEETFNYAKIIICYLDNKISEYIMWCDND